MSCLTNFTLRSLLRNRARTLVSIGGIALSCALITAIFTTVSSINAGLHLRTIQSEGSWGIYESNIADETLEGLKASENIDNLATYTEVGSAAFSAEERTRYGAYLTVKTLPEASKGSTEPGGAPLTVIPEITEGAMPSKAGEVALPSVLKGETLGNGASGVTGKDIALGSTLTLALGERLFDGTDGTERSDSTSPFIADDEAETLGISPERLENPFVRTYTVVGFYDDLGALIGNEFVATSAGLIALAAPAEAGEAFSSSEESVDFAPVVGAFATVEGFTSLSQIEGFLSDEGLDSAMIHYNLLRYQGITEERALYDTLFVIGATLALVIAAAGFSLIYNSFSISVAERTRQFGMLASIGASKRQLRRSVLFEALILGGIGIPIGVALGIGGVALVLGLTSEALATAISLKGVIPLSVDPRLVVGCAAASFAILLASAWLPASRASRIAPIDAIRQTCDVRLSKQAAHRQMSQKKFESAFTSKPKSYRADALNGPWPQTSFGVAAKLAQRNRNRQGSRSRTVVASLALSVMLLVVCGSVRIYLSPLADQAQGNAGGNADVIATFHAYTQDDEEARLAIEELVDRATNMEDVTLSGIVMQGWSNAVVPASLLDDDAREMQTSLAQDASADWVPSPFTRNGDYIQGVTTVYLDDASFASFAESLGLTMEDFEDASHPKAIGLDAYRGQTYDGRYFNLGGISRTGSLTLYNIDDDGAESPWSAWGLTESKDGEICALFMNDETAETQIRPLSKNTQTLDIEIVATTPVAPDAMNAMGIDGYYPVIIMPQATYVSAQEAQGHDMLAFSSATVHFETSDHALAAQSLEKIAAELKSKESLSVSVYDIAKEGESARMVLSAIQLFILLFSVITALVAVANVFNTLTNSIILRAREFAILESIGMGRRDFRRMIGCECAVFAFEGFAIGMLLGFAASAAMYYGASLSFAAMPFTLPWAYLAASFVLTLAILAASVAFALGKTRKATIAETLRSDAG